MKRRLPTLVMLALVAGGFRVSGAVAPPAETKEPVRLTLDQCLDLGLSQNPQLQVSQAQVDQAESQLHAAQANRYPKVGFTANAVRSNRLLEFRSGSLTMMPTSVPMSNPSGGVVPGLPTHIHLLPFPSFEISSTREGDIYGVKVEAQYAVYAGGRIKNGIKVAELNQKAAEENFRLQRNELTYRIQQAFLGVLLAQEAVKVVDNGYKTALAHYNQVKALFNEGLVSNLDLLQVESWLAQIRPQQVEARNNLRLAQLALNNLLNIDLDTPVEAVGTLEYKPRPLPPPEDLYAAAMKNRPEMRIMEYRREMALKMLEIARANAYPTVALFANYSWDRGQDMPPNDKIWQDGWQAGAVVTFSLYDGGATEAKVAEAEAMLRQVEAGLRALELGIRTQVQQAIFALRAAEEKIAAQKMNVEAAAKSHEATRVRYKAGLASNVDVLDAQSELMRANLGYLSAAYEYWSAWIQLQAAIGMPASEETGT